MLCDKFKGLGLLTDLKPVLGKPPGALAASALASCPSSLSSLKAIPSHSVELGAVPTVLGLWEPQGQAHVNLSCHIQMPIMVAETGLVYPRALICLPSAQAVVRVGS